MQMLKCVGLYYAMVVACAAGTVGGGVLYIEPRNDGDYPNDIGKYSEDAGIGYYLHVGPIIAKYHSLDATVDATGSAFVFERSILDVAYTFYDPAEELSIAFGYRGLKTGDVVSENGGALKKRSIKADLFLMAMTGAMGDEFGAYYGLSPAIGAADVADEKCIYLHAGAELGLRWTINLGHDAYLVLRGGGYAELSMPMTKKLNVTPLTEPEQAFRKGLIVSCGLEF